jgi:hypothetical protein
MKKVFISLFVLVVLLVFTLQANADLTIIGQARYNGYGGPINYNLIFESDGPFGSIVWMDYEDEFKGGYSWPGPKDFVSWLDNSDLWTYNIDPAYNVTWSGDWRLPLTAVGSPDFGYDGTTTSGYNITSSEMGYLFYTELGNKGYFDTSGNPTGCINCLTNTGPFQNLKSEWYWSGTDYYAYPNYAWAFNFYLGGQYLNDKDVAFYFFFVRPGDVTVVPEPISSTLFLIGAGVLAGRRYWRRKK